MKFRIVKEENLLTGRIVYYIERQKTWLWMSSWTRDVGVPGAPSEVCSLTLSGIKHKLEELRWGNNVVKKEVIV